MSNDTISRQTAIDAITRYNGVVDKSVAKRILIQLPPVQPETARTFVELVVEYPDPELCPYKEHKGKPYYSIKYIENGETHVGYGTYNPEVLARYLKDYFMPSAQSEIVECKDCKHRGKQIADGRYWCSFHYAFMYYCSDAERRTNAFDACTN